MVTKLTKKILPGILLLTVGFFLASGLVFKLDVRELIASLFRFPFLGFLLIFLLSFLGIVVSTWRAYLILRSQEDNINFFKLLNIWIAGHAMNYLIPFVYLGGEGVKAYLLNERMKVPWDRTASTLVFDRILEISASFLTIGVSIVAFLVYAGPAGFTKTILAVGASFLTVGVLIILFYFQVFRNKKLLEPFLAKFSLNKTRIGKFFIKAEQEVVNFFVTDKVLFFKGWAISIVKQLLLFVRHLALFYFLGKGIVAVPALISLGALYLGLTIPIPASLGVQEGFQSIAFSIIGLKASDGLALSFVLRGADILLAVAGIIIVVRYGIGFMASGARGLVEKSNVLKLNGEDKN